MCRIAMICVHSCPLAMPGIEDAGGMNVYVRELSRELGKNGMGIDIFTRWIDPRIPQVVPLGDHARVIHLKAGPLEAIPKNQVFQHLPEFICSLRRFKEEQHLHYRLLHSHYWLSGWVAGLLRQRWNVPHVAMFHTLGALKNRARPEENESIQRIETEHKIIASADVLVVSSDDEKSQMVSLYGAKPDSIRVVPCGVDLDRFRPLDRLEAKRNLGLKGSPALLFVGRIEPLKGVDLLLDVVAELREQFANLHLLVLGGEASPSPGRASRNGELRRLENQVQRLGVAENVSFVGAIDQEKLPLYYNAADICVVPSHYESFSLVAAEALACGTPVVASKVGGLQSLVVDHHNGLLVPWRSPQAFATEISLLLRNEELRNHLALAARESVFPLGWSAIAKDILGIYDELAEAAVDNELCLCGRW